MSCDRWDPCRSGFSSEESRSISEVLSDARTETLLRESAAVSRNEDTAGVGFLGVKRTDSELKRWKRRSQFLLDERLFFAFLIS